MEPWRGADMVWSSINSVMTANSMAFQLRFSATLSEIETVQSQITWHGLAQMGYQELFAVFDIIQWSHGKEQIWFGSSINSVMTANSMVFNSVGILPQCLKSVTQPR
jgi:hypothetical protein